MYKNSLIKLDLLFKKVSSIKLNKPTGVFGATGEQEQLTRLMGSIADLKIALVDSQDYESIMALYERVAGDLDAAVLTGVIAEVESGEYYELLDSVWAIMEDEKTR